VTGRCEKIENKMWSEFAVKKIAPGCPITDRWGVGIHFASNSKPRNFSQIDFFTSSRPLSLPMEEQVEYATRLIRAGVPTELHVYPGAYHGFAPLVPKARVSVAADRDSREALRRAFHG
jgi:hypothetical protein